MRGPWRGPDTLTAEAALDREQPLEQLAGAQRRLDGRGAVQEARLVEVADRIGQAQRRDADDLDALLLAQQFHSGGDLRLAVAQVGAEPDERPGHAGILQLPCPPRAPASRSVLLVALAACSPALAAQLPKHAGTPVLPFVDDASREQRRAAPAEGEARRGRPLRARRGRRPG